MDPCPVLVGRQPELSALRGLLDAGGGVAIVSGEAGIGKSRLVREFAAEAAERGRLVLWARPEEVAKPGPYALIVDLLQSISERGADAIKREALALASDLTRSDADGQRPAPNPRAVAAEIRGLIAQLGRPPLVVLEDLHWADGVSHSVVLHLARAARDDEHVYIATLRPESVVSEASLGRLLETILRDRIATEIVLGPLAADETARMLEYIWSRAPTAEELADLSRLGEGVPFFIEELASAGGRIPRTIEQSVFARVRGLGDEAARVLTAASLMTGALDVAVLALACDVPEERVAEHLTAAARAGLLEDLEDRLVFRHSLARDAIVAGLVSVEAAQTHGRLAAAIEKVHAGELDPFAGELARHYRQAGETQAAIDYAIRAGERALSFAATEEARAAFFQAVELSSDQSTSALRGLAEVEFREGNEREAASLFRKAAEALQQHGRNAEAVPVLSRLAWSLQGHVPPSGVLKVLDEALAILSSDPSSIESARIMVQKGGIQCFLLNQTSEARPTLTRALEIAELHDDSALIAEALDTLAHADELDGELTAALVLGSRAAESAKRSGVAEIIGRTYNNFGLKLAVAGRPDEALTILAQGREHLRRAYGTAAIGALDVSEGWVSWLMGLPQDVAELTARGRVAWQRWRGYRWLLETWSAIERGEQGRAEATVKEAWGSVGGDATRDAFFESPDVRNPEASAALFCEVLVSLSYGGLRDVVLVAGTLARHARLTAERFDQAQILALYAKVLATAGDFDAATSVLDELSALLLGNQTHPYLRAAAFEIQSIIARGQNFQEGAVEALVHAVSLLEQCHNMSDRARCERLLAEALTASGNKESLSDAREHLKRARGLAEGSGAVVELNRVDALARSLGLRLRSGRTPGRRSSAGQLSTREVEVAVLVAEGQTNATIAGRLFLSERTVQDHISHALKKLQLSSRAGLASWAARNGLV